MPACANARVSLPHARGGVSRCGLSGTLWNKSSPRPWGCFLRVAIAAAQALVFPTPVGVFPTRGEAACCWWRLPHARGGVSTDGRFRFVHPQSSPRPWGCFRHRDVAPPHPGGLPHARGGVSMYASPRRLQPQSSPRPWGCFSRLQATQCFSTVFPTPVGVFPTARSSAVSWVSLPHARGGVSLRVVCSGEAVIVFPTPVGVFLNSGIIDEAGNRLPHARGGVSGWRAALRTRPRSSPRPWGCFFQKVGEGLAETVFPTPVGVFPSRPTSAPSSCGLPHARGGVSGAHCCVQAIARSSPRPWGCFLRHRRT